jgi:hypothetical protein
MGEGAEVKHKREVSVTFPGTVGWNYGLLSTASLVPGVAGELSQMLVRREAAGSKTLSTRIASGGNSTSS